MRLPFPSSRQGRAWLLLLALAAALPVLPMPSYVFRLGALIFIYGSVVSSFNLLAGYCGVISVAHAGFFGIGAYTAIMFLGSRYYVFCNPRPILRESE